MLMQTEFFKDQSNTPQYMDTVQEHILQSFG